MTKYIIEPNTTAIDVSFNLSGSLTGFPVVLSQLPVSERVGFDDFPEMWEDVTPIDQTWTPILSGMELELDVPVYNTLGKQKAPYTTNSYDVEPAITYGSDMLRQLIEGNIILNT